MTLTDRSLTFLDKEISLRKEQKEYLSDYEGSVRARSLFVKLSQEIEVLENLRKMVEQYCN